MATAPALIGDDPSNRIVPPHAGAPIREASHDDIPAMLAMAERFACKAGIEETVGFCVDSVAALLAGLIDNPDGVALIGENSMAGGFVFAHPFNAAHRIGHEMYWYSEGREGLKLIQSLEAAFRERGADSVAMATLDALGADSLQKFYLRRGYRPLDRNFIKVF